VPEKVSAKHDQLCSIEIGPSLSPHLLKKADKILRNNGVDGQQKSVIGKFTFIRLLEGVYPPDKARLCLKELIPICEAFVLPKGDNLAVYAGSFQNPQNAVRFSQMLAQKDIHLTPVSIELETQGQILVVPKVYRKTAESISEEVARLGLNAKVTDINPDSQSKD
jgi:hypothetical protein